MGLQWKIIVFSILYTFASTASLTDSRNESLLVIEPVSGPARFGKGPFWDENTIKLYYVDIFGKTVNRYDPLSKTTTRVTLDNFVTFVIPIEGEKDKFIIGLGTTVAVLTWDGISRNPENVEILTNVVNTTDGTRLNEGKADDFGRLWSGTMGPRIGAITQYVPYAGILFCLNKDNTVNIKAAGVTISNGIDWSLDSKKMYYVDTGARVIFVFDYDLLQGTIRNAKILIDFQKNGLTGFPCGLTVDSEGKIWVACFQGAQVIRIDPETGRVIRSVRMTSYQPTSLTFGGPNYEDLFVTSASEEMPNALLQKYPLSGYTFRVTGLGVRGLPFGIMRSSLLRKNMTMNKLHKRKKQTDLYNIN